MVDPGEGPRGLPTLPLPLFLDQSEARGVEKKILGDRPHLFSKGLDDRVPHYLKVWIRHFPSGTSHTKHYPRQWWIQGRDPGARPPPQPPPSALPIFLDQTEARRAEKNFLGDRPPSYLRVWMTTPTLPPPLPYLKVWIRHFPYETKGN